MSRKPSGHVQGEMADDIAEILIPEAEVQAKVRELGRAISRDYAGKDLVLISVLRGGFVFLADLCRAITLPVTIDVMAVSSYGPDARPLGVVKILKDLDDPRGTGRRRSCSLCQRE